MNTCYNFGPSVYTRMAPKLNTNRADGSQRVSQQRRLDARKEKALLINHTPVGKRRLADACQDFRNELIDRFASANIQPIDMATIAWFATNAGAGGVSDLSVDPALGGRNQARTVRTALGLEGVSRRILFKIQVPKWDVSAGCRKMETLHVKLPHEALERDFLNNKEAYMKARAEPDWDVPNFLEHPITQEFGAKNCWPCGYYTDKVKLGQASFYRGSVNCTLMRRRVTVWVIKCADLCRCGCGGACTIEAIQMEMNHSMNCLQKGVFMESRFDEKRRLRDPIYCEELTSWRADEGERSRRAGTKMQFKGPMAEYRADLPERCMMSCIKTHRGICGCMECHSRAKTVHDRVAEVSLASVPWEPRTQTSYLAEVDSHVIKVRITEASACRRLVNALAWQDQYPWGRRVVGNKGTEWGLRALDKLCASDDIRNPHDLVESLELPVDLVFFRPVGTLGKALSSLSGVSMLFNIPGVHSLGIDHFLVRYFCECTLHTLDLGVAQRFCGTAMVLALQCNFYNLSCSGKTQLVRRGVGRMGADIKAYYKAEQKQNPDKQLSRLASTFTYKSLGVNLDAPCLKAKGGETRGLVKFCVKLMHDAVRKQVGLKAKKLRRMSNLAQAGEKLMDMYAVMEREPRCMSLEARQKLLASAVNHVLLYKLAGGHLVPKHHGIVHMALSAGQQGNPKFVSTYEDEHENGSDAKVGLHVHGMTFEVSTFERIELQNKRRRVLYTLP